MKRSLCLVCTRVNEHFAMSKSNASSAWCFFALFYYSDAVQLKGKYNIFLRGCQSNSELTMRAKEKRDHDTSTAAWLRLGSGSQQSGKFRPKLSQTQMQSGVAATGRLTDSLCCSSPR